MLRNGGGWRLPLGVQCSPQAQWGAGDHLRVAWFRLIPLARRVYTVRGCSYLYQQCRGRYALSQMHLFSDLRGCDGSRFFFVFLFDLPEMLVIPACFQTCTCSKLLPSLHPAACGRMLWRIAWQRLKPAPSLDVSPIPRPLAPPTNHLQQSSTLAWRCHRLAASTSAPSRQPTIMGS